MEFDKFLLWEATTRDTIDFKTIYVDIAGDLIAGLLLSQIIYWHLPKKNGVSKMKSISRDGHYWIAKPYSGWYDEIRITDYQAKRALKLLSEKGLVETKLFKFSGAPTIHTRLIKDHFLTQLEIWINKKPLNPFEGNCLIHSRETDDSLIETTIKNNNNNKREGKPEKFDEILEMIERYTGNLQSQADIKAIQEMVKLDIIEEDIAAAVKFFVDAGKAARGAHHLFNSAKYNRDKRVQTEATKDVSVNHKKPTSRVDLSILERMKD
jgi:hypothetical protein